MAAAAAAVQLLLHHLSALNCSVDFHSSASSSPSVRPQSEQSPRQSTAAEDGEEGVQQSGRPPRTGLMTGDGSSVLVPGNSSTVSAPTAAISAVEACAEWHCSQNGHIAFH